MIDEARGPREVELRPGCRRRTPRSGLISKGEAKEVNMKLTVYDGKRDMDGVVAEVAEYLGLV